MPARPPSSRLSAGVRIEPRRVENLLGAPVPLPDPGGHVHLQFRRFAGCPVCSLHLRDFVRRRAEIEAAGLREVVVFHSRAEALRTYAADLPFDVIADPGKALYRAFAVEAGLRALLHLRAVGPIFRAVAEAVRTGARPPALRPEGGRYGLPADFLIAPDGRLIAVHYGEHVDDQWSVDDLLALAPATRAQAAE